VAFFHFQRQHGAAAEQGLPRAAQDFILGTFGIQLDGRDIGQREIIQPAQWHGEAFDRNAGREMRHVILGGAGPLFLRRPIQDGHGKGNAALMITKRQMVAGDMGRCTAKSYPKCRLQPGKGAGQGFKSQHLAARQACQRNGQQPIMRADIDQGARAMQQAMEIFLIHDEFFPFGLLLRLSCPKLRPGSEKVMPQRLCQLIYTSRPFGFNAPMLDDILTAARSLNAQHEITGALICRADMFMQMLEGPRAAVTETFGRIQADDRHVDVALLYVGDTPERIFPDWTMRDDPPQSWMWNQAEVREGAMQEASAAAAYSVFRRLSRLPPERRAV
jgi:hypothetical protein